MKSYRYFNKNYLIGLSFGLIIASIVLLNVSVLAAGLLPNRSITLSNSTPAATNVIYNVSFAAPANYDLGSIAIQFCQESPLINQPCSQPLGFSASGVLLNDQSGETGFTINSDSTGNRVVLGRTSSLTSGGSVSYSLSGITNPSLAREFFARIYLYNSSDGTGVAAFFGGIALTVNGPIAVNTTVPPFLLFCAAVNISGYDCSTGTDYYINFGNLNVKSTQTATTQMVLGTNADYGLSVYYVGNTLTAGNNIITGLTSQQPSMIGTAQFGLNLRLNTLPSVGQDPVGLGRAYVTSQYNTPNRYRFVSGDAVVEASGVVDYVKFTSSYIVNIADTNQPGVYSTTIFYICLANF